MEVLSHSTHMIKQTMQTFPWRYYLIIPHDQTNNTHISMEVLSHGVVDRGFEPSSGQTKDFKLNSIC